MENTTKYLAFNINHKINRAAIMQTKTEFHTNSKDNGVTYFVDTVDIQSGIQVKLSAKEYLKELKTAQSKYKDESVFALFKPVACIVYYSVFGWTGQFIAKFYSNLDQYNRDTERVFFDEPTGKYGKRRKTFLIK